MNPDYPPEQGKGVIEVSVKDGGKDFERWQRTAEAAFFRAEARGFAPGHELEDWLSAEREIGDATADAATPASTEETSLASAPSVAPLSDGAVTAASASASSAQKPVSDQLLKTKRATRKTKPGSHNQLGGAA